MGIEMTYTDTGGEEHCLEFEEGVVRIDIIPKDIAKIDLSPLTSFTSLETFALQYNQIRAIDLAPLTDCVSLKRLDLSFNKLQRIDLTPLSSCPSLQHLNFSGNQLQSADLTPLASCTSLKRLDLSFNKLQRIDLTPLASCTSLRIIILKQNYLQRIDLTPLSSCTSLQRLDFSDNKLQEIDLTPLPSCTFLKYLFLNQNSLQTIDLVPLSSCTSLEELRISYNQFRRIDLTPLYSCTSIEEVVFGKDMTTVSFLSSNALSEENQQLLWHVKRTDVPVVYTDLGYIVKLVPVVSKQEACWKILHLLQCARNAVGLEGVGLLDLPVRDILDYVQEGRDEEEIRNQIIKFVHEQLDRGGTTIGFDIEWVGTIEDLALKTPQVVGLRQEEMDQIVLKVDRNVDLRPLWCTAYGFKALSTLGLGLVCSREEFRQVTVVLENLGLSVRTTRDYGLVYPSGISDDLKEYVFVLVEHRDLVDLPRQD